MAFCSRYGSASPDPRPDGRGRPGASRINEVYTRHSFPVMKGEPPPIIYLHLLVPSASLRTFILFARSHTSLPEFQAAYRETRRAAFGQSIARLSNASEVWRTSSSRRGVLGGDFGSLSTGWIASRA